MAPVIDYVSAGDWGLMNKPYAAESAQFEPISDDDGDAVFWLEVIGDSMTGTTGQSVPEGYLIKVDPSVKPKHGSLVVAKLDESAEATFKKLVIDSGLQFLKPLNPSYPTIQIGKNGRIVGVVTEAKVKFQW
jgi:SOS-response transcriptional repressor LexA